MSQQEEILKVNMRCERCGTIWQFQNTQAVAEKSIDHHIKSGECDQNYARKNRPVGTYQGYYSQTSSGTSTITWPTWANPQAGTWNYYL